MHMQLPIYVPDVTEDSSVSESVAEEQITVSESESCVPESHLKFIIQKVAELLKTQGIPCCECPNTQYILSPLSACKSELNQYTLSIICPYGSKAFQFELTIHPDVSAIPEPSDVPVSATKGGE